mmetsp:Transcript_13459/g.34493  ORF Transcript_13459/g.34493 Transcript_13459/m.34493 type:complete len:84 (+) Transcript_13459:42-293(+)
MPANLERPTEVAYCGPPSLLGFPLPSLLCCRPAGPFPAAPPTFHVASSASCRQAFSNESITDIAAVKALLAAHTSAGRPWISR